MNYYNLCEDINLSYVMAESYLSNGNKGMAEACLLQAKSKASEFEKKIMFSWEQKSIDKFNKQCDKLLVRIKQD